MTGWKAELFLDWDSVSQSSGKLLLHLPIFMQIVVHPERWGPRGSGESHVTSHVTAEPCPSCCERFLLCPSVPTPGNQTEETSLTSH